MYLRQAFVKNSGPIDEINIAFPFSEVGNPIPVIIRGRNGAGKSNLLSHITDALLEIASVQYSEVLPSEGASRKYFRVCGGRSIKAGSEFLLSCMLFDENGTQIKFRERAGQISLQDARALCPIEGFEKLLAWDSPKNDKAVDSPKDAIESAFENSIILCALSKRENIPHWYNRSLEFIRSEVGLKYASRLPNPIMLDGDLDGFASWLIDVLVETRRDVAPMLEGGVVKEVAVGARVPGGMENWIAANRILRALFNNPNARFVWLGRKSGAKIGIDLGDDVTLSGLDSLSAGQSSLLQIFGSLLRYADTLPRTAAISEFSGICVVDEIDANLHLDMELNALPNLMRIFPKVQFIFSAHSPFTCLGMEKAFGKDGVEFLDPASGVFNAATDFSEFEVALQAITETQEFADLQADRLRGQGKCLILVEGETDAPYLIAAIKALGRGDLLEKFDIEWVGAKTESGNSNSGKSGLDNALKVFKANSFLLERKVILLYDSDAKKKDEEAGMIFVRSLPFNSENNIARSGIENLLPEKLFREEFYSVSERALDYGGAVTHRRLDKVKLCQFVCENGDDEAFARFTFLPEMLEALL